MTAVRPLFNHSLTTALCDHFVTTLLLKPLCDDITLLWSLDHFIRTVKGQENGCVFNLLLEFFSDTYNKLEQLELEPEKIIGI